MYCTTTDAYRYAGITITEISAANMKEFILDAEVEVDRVTNTTYWSIENSGTATAGANSTITDSTKAFGTASELVGDYVWIYDGTGEGQLQKILSHTATVITIDSTWETNPDNTSKYKIIHTGNDPRRVEYRKGDGTPIIFTEKYPIIQLNSVTIDSQSITLTDIYQTNDTGQLALKKTSVRSYWSAENPEACLINYWYGLDVYRQISKLTAIRAAMSALNAQMGATHNIPSGYSLPEGSITIGQAYVNIKGTIDVLNKEYDKTLESIRKFPYFG